jgi:hypothetical protein
LRRVPLLHRLHQGDPAGSQNAAARLAGDAELLPLAFCSLRPPLWVVLILRALPGAGLTAAGLIAAGLIAAGAGQNLGPAARSAGRGQARQRYRRA